MSLKYQVVPVTSFSQNCSIVWCDETMDGIVVDPGGDVEQLSSVIKANGINITQLVLTHGHLIMLVELNHFLCFWVASIS